MIFDTTHPEVLDAVRRALAEDVGFGDITTQLTVPAGTRAEGVFRAKEPLIVAGIELVPLIYAELGGGVEVQIHVQSGAHARPGDTLATARGPAATLLTAERTALNFMQRLSGVATLARAFSDAVRGTRCRVLDTRKTTPGLRRLEKMAAASGCVNNHRMGLYDALLIKNNHIAAAGGVRAALAAVGSHPFPAEIEVRTLEELDDALAGGAARVLLDNLTPGQAREWIARIAGRATVELSGGITLENARAYAEAGADYISSGAITHSARAVDIHFTLSLE